MIVNLLTSFRFLEKSLKQKKDYRRCHVAFFEFLNAQEVSNLKSVEIA
jgi:hypothetical protein